MTIFVVLSKHGGYAETAAAFHTQAEAEAYIEDQKHFGMPGWKYDVQKTLLMAPQEPTAEQWDERAEEAAERSEWENRVQPIR